jgi:hypothetical protein
VYGSKVAIFLNAAAQPKKRGFLYGGKHYEFVCGVSSFLEFSKDFFSVLVEV